MAISSLLRALSNVNSVRRTGGSFGVPAAAPTPAPAIVPRQVAQPEPRIEARRVIHPDPRIEPRQVIHPAPRIELRQVEHASRPVRLPDPAPAPVEAVHKSTSPIQPPWAVLPWKQPPEVHLPERVKIVLRLPDSPVKGRILDMFV